MNSSTDSGDLSLVAGNVALATDHTTTTYYNQSQTTPLWTPIVIFGAPSLAVCVGIVCAVIFTVKKCRKCSLLSKQPAETEGDVSPPDVTPYAATETEFHAYEDIEEPRYCEVLTTLQRSVPHHLLDSSDYEEISGGTLNAKVKSLRRKRFPGETTLSSDVQSLSLNSTVSEQLLEMQHGQSEESLITTNTALGQMSNNASSSLAIEINNESAVNSCIPASRTVPNCIINLPSAGHKPSNVSATASDKPLYCNEKPKMDLEIPDSDYVQLSPRPERKPRIYTRLTVIFRPRPNKKDCENIDAKTDDNTCM